MIGKLATRRSKCLCVCVCVKIGEQGVGMKRGTKDSKRVNWANCRCVCVWVRVWYQPPPPLLVIVWMNEWMLFFLVLPRILFSWFCPLLSCLALDDKRMLVLFEFVHYCCVLSFIVFSRPYFPALRVISLLFWLSHSFCPFFSLGNLWNVLLFSSTNKTARECRWVCLSPLRDSLLLYSMLITHSLSTLN